MRLIRKIATTIALAGLPVALVSGCAPGAGGASLAPPASSPAAAGVAQEYAARVPAAKTETWPQFGYDEGHSGFNPLEQTIDAKNVSNLQIAWNDQSLIQPGGIVVGSSAVYVDDMGQSNAGLYALNSTTGTQKWYANVNLNGPWGNFTHAVAAIAGNVVVTPCSNGSSSKFLTGLCGVNAKNGKILWKTYCSEYQGNACEGLVNGTSPAYYDKLVYFQSTQGVNEQPDTQALDPKSGKIVWDVPGVYHCPDAGDSSSNPLPVSDGEVFAVLGCGGTQGATEICAFATSSGSTIWCDQLPTAYISSFIAANGQLYVAQGESSNVVVVALNAKSGAKAWSASLPGQNSTTLAAANKRVFVEDGGAGLFALSATNGKALWSYTANGNLVQGGVLSVANGLVYTDGGGGNNGNVALTAFSETSGAVVWSSGSVGNGAAPATPVIVNGTVYAGCYTVCALTLPS